MSVIGFLEIFSTGPIRNRKTTDLTWFGNSHVLLQEVCRIHKRIKTFKTELDEEDLTRKAGDEEDL